MNRQETERLIDKYLEGATSPEEELLLAGEVNRPDAPAEWKVIATMLGTLTLDEAEYDRTVKSEEWSEESEEKSVKREEKATRSISRWKGWSIAASLIIVLGIGWLVGRNLMNPNKEIAEIQGENYAIIGGEVITDEARVLAMAKSTVTDVFSNSDAENTLYEIFNPE